MILRCEQLARGASAPRSSLLSLTTRANTHPMLYVAYLKGAKTATVTAHGHGFDGRGNLRRQP